VIIAVWSLAGICSTCSCGVIRFRWPFCFPQDEARTKKLALNGVRAQMGSPHSSETTVLYDLLFALTNLVLRQSWGGFFYAGINFLGLKRSLVIIKAQIMRAIVLTIATAATFVGLRSNNLTNQG